MITVDSIVTFAQANPFKTGIVGYGSIHLLFRWVYTLIGKLLKAIYNASKRLLFSNPNIPQEKAIPTQDVTDSPLFQTPPLFNPPVDSLSKKRKRIKLLNLKKNLKPIKQEVMLQEIPEDNYLDLTK